MQILKNFAFRIVGKQTVIMEQRFFVLAGGRRDAFHSGGTGRELGVAQQIIQRNMVKIAEPNNQIQRRCAFAAFII